MNDLPARHACSWVPSCAAGALLVAIFVPHSFANPLLFATLLGCSSLASALKVRLPLAASGSTMSVSYAVDFAALLLLGADETMIVAAISAWAQCTFRTTDEDGDVQYAVQHGVAGADRESGRVGIHAARRHHRLVQLVAADARRSRSSARPPPTLSATRC